MQGIVIGAIIHGELTRLVSKLVWVVEAPVEAAPQMSDSRWSVIVQCQVTSVEDDASSSSLEMPPLEADRIGLRLG